MTVCLSVDAHSTLGEMVYLQSAHVFLPLSLSLYFSLSLTFLLFVCWLHNHPNAFLNYRPVTDSHSIHRLVHHLQAILFYTPRYLWKMWEGGKIHGLIMDLDVVLCSQVEKRAKKRLLLEYLWDNLK